MPAHPQLHCLHASAEGLHSWHAMCREDHEGGIWVSVLAGVCRKGSHSFDLWSPCRAL